MPTPSLPEIFQGPALEGLWYVACASTELDSEKPLAREFMGRRVVLWRTTEGGVAAWLDLCIHRGAMLSLGHLRDGCLECPYHGWKYDERGRCVEIPAHPKQSIPSKAQAETFHAVERCGLIWVNFHRDEDTAPLPYPPEFVDAAYRPVVCGPITLEAGAPRAIENFLDVAHFPYVHEGTLGDRSRPEMPDYEVTWRDERPEVDRLLFYQPNPDGESGAGMAEYDYHVVSPFVATLGKTVAQDKRLVIALFVTPLSETRSSVTMVAAMNFGEQSDEEIRQFQLGILREDIPIVQSQRPELLPLDLREELHLRSDRLSIAYRQYLRKIGLRFGTA
jgi:phenylpropionate dioxygenase-like ring-hydroxylating dioxygenase large terminal subunit